MIYLYTFQCPYYASRKAIDCAEIICLPYNMILHDEIRKSLGIDLRENIVIFDEAHNLEEVSYVTVNFVRRSYT